MDQGYAIRQPNSFELSFVYVHSVGFGSIRMGFQKKDTPL